jgi:hypothetical protein
MPQALGSGVALFDFNKDGKLDLYLLQNGGPGSRSTNRLYQQTDDGKFKEVTGSGLEIGGHNMGVAIADVNNDGWPDVLVTQYGGIKLFLNNGDGKTFTDITEEAGLSNPAWGMSAAFLDFDRDGWLDLAVVNYVDYNPDTPCTARSGQRDYCPPSAFGGRVCKLFRNVSKDAHGKGHGVRFEDVTQKSGLGELPGPGLGVVCADFNGDGWPDIFVANDGVANRLWINRHDGTFAEEAAQRNVAVNVMAHPEAGMGVAIGDVDGNGLFDLFVTHLTEETNTLWLQEPRGLFSDKTRPAGLAGVQSRGTGFGTFLGDFRNGGALDLAVVNGRVSWSKSVANAALGPHWGHYAERNRLFANDGRGKFRDVSADNPAFCGTANVARGLACGDFDNDGGLDLVVTTIASRARLYRNVAPRRGHWLSVRTFDPALKRDAYGAEIRVRGGGRTWLRIVNPGTSYLCSNDVRAHVGLGEVGRVEEIEVTWPDGPVENSVEVFDSGGVDRFVVLERGKGKKGRWRQPPAHR